MARGDDSLHETLIRDRPVTGSSNRGFGLTFAGFFALLCGLSAWRGGAHWPWWLGAAIVCALVALTVPAILAPFNWVWTRLGLLLHRIVNPIVMAVIFFGAVVPLGLLMRLLGKRPLSLVLDAKASSYWIERSETRTGSMTQQF
jgi:hypothetical protein